MDDIILCSNGTTTNTFFKPYMKTRGKNNGEKENEQCQMKRKSNGKNLEANNTSNAINDERPYKKMCNVEKFEAVKYSLRPNEEYIAIRRCENNAYERTKFVKVKQEKDKIGTKPDENGKRGRAQQCQSPVTIEKAKKRRNTDSRDQYWQILEDVFIQDKNKG
nr:hypothetical protein [Tanacetum cinerariifolium]